MAVEAQSKPTAIDPRTSLGAVSLTVLDLARSREFYEHATGLTGRELDDGSVGLGVSGEPELIRLYADAAAPRLDRRATGLYHLAILLPRRRDLAVALARLARARWPLDGASDHLVSEALYLSDPDGNGIEIYRDRPREQWRYDDGTLQMATLPLDLEDVIGELDGATGVDPLAPAGTTIGHVHLQVSELRDIEAFYNGIIGLDVVVRGYPQALFMSAGGYHHHVGLNTWQSAGGSPPPPGAIGLRDYELVVPSEAERERVLSRVRAAGVPIDTAGGAPLLRDPSGNGVRLISRAPVAD